MDNTVFQILDANLNRTREGLRVVEEIARFVLRDEKLTKKIKAQRHKLAKLFKDMPLLEYRDTSKDLGKDGNFDKVSLKELGVGNPSYKNSQVRRPATTRELSEIARRNLKRAQEGCRTMEEFSKLLTGLSDNGNTFKTIKEIRFTIYDIEKEIVGKLKTK